MRLPNFCGPTYVAPSVNVDAERSINLFPAFTEAPGAKARLILQGTPGLSLWKTLDRAPLRALFEQDGRAFAIAGNRLYELGSGGTATDRGTVDEDGARAWIASNGVGGSQLFIVSASKGYNYNLTTNTLTRITVSGFPAAVTGAAFIDGYFVTLNLSTGALSHSALNDGTSWAGADVQQRNRGSDQFRGAFVSQNLIWLLGRKTGEVWYDLGGTTVFAPVQGVFLEQGLAAPASLVGFDNSVAWLGQDVNGVAMVWKAQGYSPLRISTHAVEHAIQGYSVIDDAEAWTAQIDGHSVYVLNFPTAKASWLYNAATQLWSELGYWNAAAMAYEAHLGRCHCFAFGKHLVGDRRSGNIYEWRLDVYTDGGDTIRRVRRAPHLSNENRWLFYSRFELDFEAGVGLSSGQGSEPTLLVRTSVDGGHTWGNERQASLGKLGDYTRRAVLYRLGRARSMTFEVAISDPVKVALFDAFVEAEVGTS